MNVCYGYNLFRRSFPDLISSTNQYGVCKYYSLISIEHFFVDTEYDLSTIFKLQDYLYWRQVSLFICTVKCICKLILHTQLSTTFVLNKKNHKKTATK